MSNEMRMIQPLYGPYAGQTLNVAQADAERAVAENWAIDPYAPAKPAKDITDQEREKMVRAAEKAARKWRGEPDNDNTEQPKEAKPSAEPPSRETRDMLADEGRPYQTRSETAPRGKK